MIADEDRRGVASQVDTGGTLCTVHQPNLFPRLSTLAKLFTADHWVVLNDVQFVRRDYQHRTRLAGLPDSSSRQWLSVPVHLPAGRRTMIRDVLLVDRRRARRRVEMLIQQFYGRSPHWPALRTVLGEVLAAFDRTDRLAHVAEVSARALLHILGWRGTVHDSSVLPARPGRSERLVDLVRAVESRRYLCGTGGVRYLDRQPFVDAGVDVHYFAPPADGPSIWQSANQVSTLCALMAVGPTELERELRQHASRWESAPRGADPVAT